MRHVYLPKVNLAVLLYPPYLDEASIISCDHHHYAFSILLGYLFVFQNENYDNCENNEVPMRPWAYLSTSE